jgi:hypothetical protein
MHPGSFLLALLLLLWNGLAGAAPDSRNLQIVADGEKRVALVIGNSAYPGLAALKNPVNDASDIAAKLRSLGFDVTLKTNVNLKQMLRAMTEFGGKLSDGSVALFFYAGHGMQVRGKNYLIPVDAEILSEAAVSSEAADADQLLDKLAPARVSMVILDACRNNPFERKFRSGGGGGLAQMNAPAGTLVAYATAPGKTASDGTGRNGLYTHELLSAMGEPNRKVEDVFKRVRTNVLKKSRETQIPWESSSLTGDFYFMPGAALTPSPAAPETPPPPATAVDEAERMLWQAVERSNNPADYEIYLKQYSRGHYVQLAMARLDQLKEEAATQEESNAWKTAEQGSKADVATYLERFPNGKYAGLARLRLARIQTEETKATDIYVGKWICVMKAATGPGHTCHFEITRGRNNDILIAGAYEWKGFIGAGVKKPFSNARLLDDQLEFQIVNISDHPNSTVKLRPVSASRLEGTVNDSSLIYATKQ